MIITYLKEILVFEQLAPIVLTFGAVLTVQLQI